MDIRLVLGSVKLDAIAARALGRQANVSGPTQTIHHSEDLIPRGIRTTIDELFQQKTGLIGKHPAYSTTEITLSHYVSHDHAPF